MTQSTFSGKVSHVKAAKLTRKHSCHWPGCINQVPPAMWGCRRHWYMLPKYLRDKIWSAYRPGQEDDMHPDSSYLDAANEVQEWITKYKEVHG